MSSLASHLLNGTVSPHEYDGMHRPPGGIKPCPLFSLSPFPTGALAILLMAVFSTCVHTFQVITLAHHGDFMFAFVCAFFVVMTIGFVAMNFKIYGNGIWFEVKKSVARGLATPALQLVPIAKGIFEAVGLGFLATYAMTQQTNLGYLSAANACLGLVLSTVDVSKTLMNFQAGGYSMQIAAMRALRPIPFVLVQLWLMLQVSCEFVLFSVTSRVLHPMITFAIYAAIVPVIVIPSKLTVSKGKCLEAVLFLASPTSFFVPLFGSLFGTTFPFFIDVGCFKMMGPNDNKEPNPARWTLASTICRLIGCGILMCSCNLPRGLGFGGSLTRPMGLPVLFEEFITPTLSLMSNTESQRLELGAAIFRAFLTLIFVVGVPVYFLVSVLLLLCHSSYVDGVADVALTIARDELVIEIDAWADERERALTCLSDDSDVN